MMSRRVLPILLLVLWISAILPAQAEVVTPEDAAKLPYTMAISGFEDSGTFLLYINEEPVGTIDFTWSKDGAFANHLSLSLGGQVNTVDTLVKPDDQGAWKTIEMKTSAGTVQMEREGRLVKKTFRDETSTVNLEEKSLLYDNYGPALMTEFIKHYDREKAGKQTLSIFIAGAIVVQGSIERLADEERALEGKDLVLERYALTLHMVDLTLTADKDGRILLEDVPSQKAYFVRKGFEGLAVKAAEDPLLSKPTFSFKIQKDAMVPMRDKVKLAADLYLPETQGKVPIVLIRTPYGKELSELTGKYWARRGYACCIQDCRGRFKSEGAWTPFMNEAEDGYDTIEWLAAQPWASGKVGMIGGSYLGWVQWWAASLNPPHLTTIIPNVAPPDPHYNIPYEYGTFFLLGSIWWAQILESGATADLSGKAMLDIGESDYSKILAALPVVDLDLALLGRKNPYWRSWIDHPDDDKFWDKANFSGKLKNLKIPVFHQSGWFDGDGIGTKLNYLKMTSHGHGNQKLILGPWGHTDTAHRGLGDEDFGPQAVIDLQREYLRWFDYWLKGVANGTDTEPLVRMFVMRSNKWFFGNAYPLEITKPVKLYLGSGGKANTGKGDGRLSFEPPKGAESDAFTYDPADPTPDPGFYPTKSKEELQKLVLSEEQEKANRKGYHRATADRRQDLLVYVTEPLPQALTICGPLSAVLYASSSAKDTDWFVTLSEEKSCGDIFTLARGKIRARYRESLAKPKPLKPGAVVPYTLDLWHTGITLAKGSRLRVEVASALFPTFSRNLNTGGHNETETAFVKADQMVFHSEKYPSHILLPVVP